MRLPAIAMSLAVLAAGLTLRPTSNDAEERVCETLISSAVQELYETWQTTMRSGDVEAVTALYSPDAILMGPGASSIRLGRREIAAYFTDYMRPAPAATIIERVVRSECGAANDVGLEAVTFGADGTVQDGGAQDVARRGTPARFSLFYVLKDGRWLIVHHHQEMLGPLPANMTATDNETVAVSGSAGITTATSARPATPPPPGADDANRRMQFVLPLPRVPNVQPIDFAALDRLVALTPLPVPKPMSEPVHVVLPTAPFAFSPGRPLLDVPRETAALTAPRLWPAAPIELPVPAFAVSLAPPRIIDEVSAITPDIAIDSFFALPPTRMDSAARPAIATPPIVLTGPAVAGHAQRLPTPVSPTPPAGTSVRPVAAATLRAPAVVAKAAPQVASPSAVATKDPPLKTGRFLRWEDSTPVFDD